MLGTIGIRCEDKDRTERRAPLTPAQVGRLVHEHGIRVVVEPAENRIFSEKDYEGAGASISDDLSLCNVIFGVKEVPIARILPEKAFCFFSHTIKGQAYNMPMLKAFLERRCTLIDYERVIDRQGERLISFSRFAGIVGIIDTLWILGQRLQWEGYRTPFLHMQQANRYADLAEARSAVLETAERLRREGLPAALSPLVFGFTGGGRVAHGAQELFDLLPHETVAPRDLPALFRSGSPSRHVVYKAVFRRGDRVRPRDPARPFDAEDYLAHPEHYENAFEDYLPFLTVVVNGIYWEPGFPRLITREGIRRLYAQSTPRLRVIADITCDIGGSVEVVVRATNSLAPVYVYDPKTGDTCNGWEGHGPVILAVDKLPSELPREASQAFGDMLLPYVPRLARADFSLPFEALVLPDPWKPAVIAHRGELAPGYRYLETSLAVATQT